MIQPHLALTLAEGVGTSKSTEVCTWKGAEGQCCKFEGAKLQRCIWKGAKGQTCKLKGAKAVDVRTSKFWNGLVEHSNIEILQDPWPLYFCTLEFAVLTFSTSEFVQFWPFAPLSLHFAHLSLNLVILSHLDCHRRVQPFQFYNIIILLLCSDSNVGSYQWLINPLRVHNTYSRRCDKGQLTASTGNCVP